MATSLFVQLNNDLQKRLLVNSLQLKAALRAQLCKHRRHGTALRVTQHASCNGSKVVFEQLPLSCSAN